MTLTKKEIEHLRKVYPHMNEFALKDAVGYLLETVDAYKQKYEATEAYVKGKQS